ncbi:AAA family ATPase [Duganella fentianensis]|uniref:McrB family protein n=1 Tax=Duganella fentianensis TaxID=2692177 RepID=UPI0032B1AF45
MSASEVTTRLPDFNWTDADLLKFMAENWGMVDPNHIRVRGRLRVADAGGFGFLEDLSDAVSGIKLQSLSHISRVQQGVFVAPPDLDALLTRSGPTEYAVAELMLAPLFRRQQRNDPLACMVRPHSLMALSRAPETWGLKSTEEDRALLLLDQAREAITAQLEQDTAKVATKLEHLQTECAQQEATQKVLQATLDEADERLLAVRQQTEALNVDFNVRSSILEDKLRALDSLLRQRGERLVALDLVEKEDLLELIPPSDQSDTRIGHDYLKVLAGDFAQLAPFIQARLWSKNMLFSQGQLRDFLALMRTHDLVVLAGDSGSGKTSLVRAVADSIGGRCTVIPVKPNWTGPEDLLGYYNPIERSYHATPFLLALQAAEREPEIIHFICLDEMNLARVEHYFADFLSLLEERDKTPIIPLYLADEEQHVVVEYNHFLTLEQEARHRTGMKEGATFLDMLLNEQANATLHQLGGFQDNESILLHHSRLRRSARALIRTPSCLRFPSNVRIIGAVNIDETTHYLSPKVLDRAHVLRFRNPLLMDWDAIQAEVQHFEVDITLPLRLSAEDLGLRGSYPAYDRTAPYAALLTKLTRDHLAPLGVEFGLRAIRQSLGYLQAAQAAGIDDLTALDNIVQHKILPKLMLDSTRTDASGRSKREILISLREALAVALAGLQPSVGEETALTALDQLIGSLNSNNGIANYWLR